MTPIEVAAAVYDREPCVRTFSEDLHAHYDHGYVFSTPDYFLMARKVYRYAQPHQILNPYFNLWESPPNCWHVYLYAGNMSAAFKCADVQLSFVSFEKRNRLKVYTWADIHKRTARFFRS